MGNRWLNNAVRKIKAEAEMNGADGISKTGSIKFYFEDDPFGRGDPLHHIFLREWTLRDIYEDLKKYFEEK